MRIHPNIAILEIPVVFGTWPTKLNLVVIDDPEHGATLIDTAVPGKDQEIFSGMEHLGLAPADLRRIVITHADSDHIGSMKALKDRSGAEITCLDSEAGYVSGERPPYKSPPPERLEEDPELKALIESVQRVKPDHLVKDGEKIPGAFGARAIATPGHTPGHMSVYIPEFEILITGDALTSNDGVLAGPMEQATPDMESARASVRKLSELRVEQIVCYHGGLVNDDAQGQLRRLAIGMA